MIYFSIKELEVFSGIKAHTIRTWEQRFSFLQPQRTSKLRRTYSLDELKLLLDISFLNRNGNKVSHIAKMDKLAIDTALISLSATSQLREKAVNELITGMASMDYNGFDRVLNDCVLSWGIESSIQHIILPFAQKAGMLRPVKSKTYKPNLLLIEQSLKQKIILGIENASSGNNSKMVLLFPYKKSNELELLYIQYVLKAKGFSTIFLNDFNSLRTLEIITTATKPNYIITALADKKQLADNKKFLQFLSKHLPAAEFYNLGNSKVRGALQEGKLNGSDDVEKLIELILQKTSSVTLQNAY